MSLTHRKSAVVLNYYEIDQLPVLILEKHPLHHSFTYNNNLMIRNMTHRYSSILCKIFAFWPSYSLAPSDVHYLSKQAISDQSDKVIQCQITYVMEMPILSAEKLVYLFHDLLKSQTITEDEWNFVGDVEAHKQNCTRLIEQLMIRQNQFKFKSPSNALAYNVYYRVEDRQFVVKACLKSFQFDIYSSSSDKKQKGQDPWHGLVVHNQKVRQHLHQLLTEKLRTQLNDVKSKQVTQKIQSQYVKFYERHEKQIDEQILKLQIYFNFPNLRIKYFMPYKFNDAHDNQQLVGPIFSNANRYCMYGHFSGYNSSTYFTLANQCCQYCGIRMTEMKRNLLLEYLRDNLFNYDQNSIQYCPEFNRFKLMTDVRSEKEEEEEEKQMRRVLRKLKIKDKQQTEQRNNGASTEDKGPTELQSFRPYDQSQGSETEMVSENSCSPRVELKYANFMHFLSVTRKLYAKKRMQINLNKEVETVNYFFRIPATRSPSNAQLFSKSNGHTQFQERQLDDIFSDVKYELAYPARGKFCHHLEFADLRAFYRNRGKKSNGFVNQSYFMCPICGLQLRDSQVLYLRQATPLITMIKKCLGPSSQHEETGRESPSQDNSGDALAGQKDINSVRIVINNLMETVFIEFNLRQGDSPKHYYKEVDSIYKSLKDPFIPFSDDGLGFKDSSTSKLMGEDNHIENQIEKLEQDWFDRDIRAIQL